jgi:hypothetical protein
MPIIQLLGRVRQEEHDLRPAQAKIFARPHLNGKKLDMDAFLSS